MTEFRLVREFDGVQRVADGAMIPNDPRNRDWRAFQEWLAEGHEPDPEPPITRPEPPELEPVRVADPENEADAVNLRTLDERLNEINQRIDELDQSRRMERSSAQVTTGPPTAAGRRYKDDA